MKPFRVAVLRDGAVKLETHMLPPRQPGEIDVAVTLAAVCGSDLHTISGARPADPGTGLGHEAVGIISATDKGQTDFRGAPLMVGDRVVFGMIASCYTCDRCRAGLPMKCRKVRKYGHITVDEAPHATGMLADTVRLVPGVTVLRAPNDVADEVLVSAACAVPTAQAIIQKIDAQNVQTVGIIGAGAVGLYLARMCADQGFAVTVQEIDLQRATYSAGYVTTVPQLADEFDVTVEVSGSVQGTRDAFDYARIGGTVVLAGSVSPGAVSLAFDPSEIVLRRLSVYGVHNYTPADFVAGVDWLAKHNNTAPTLSNEIFPLERIDAAIAAAKARSAIRVVVSP